VRNAVGCLLVVCGIFAAIGPAALAQGRQFPLKGDDGAPVANHRVAAELASEIERQAGIVTLGNRDGDVTLVEFYDLNCPYCRKAAPEIAAMLGRDKKLKLILVPFPVLSIASIEAARVEIALASLATPAQFYDFHRSIFAGRGAIDGTRALAVAKELGFGANEMIEAANDDHVTEAMKSHVRLGDALRLAATPAFVVKGVAILGYPGRKALESIVRSARRCNNVVC
jgi:protein-disulfide isomerase